MPQIFKFKGYAIYFWSRENEPLEPIHIHVAKGVPHENATKIWITKKLKTKIANNASQIPSKDLKRIQQIIEMRVFEIVESWKNYFKTSCVKFYC